MPEHHDNDTGDTAPDNHSGEGVADTNAGQVVATDASNIIARVLPTAPAALATIVAFSYVAGFVIVNTNLLRYRVYDIEFITTRYLIAGILYDVMLVLALWPFFAFSRTPVLEGDRASKAGPRLLILAPRVYRLWRLKCVQRKLSRANTEGKRRQRLEARGLKMARHVLPLDSLSADSWDSCRQILFVSEEMRLSLSLLRIRTVELALGLLAILISYVLPPVLSFVLLWSFLAGFAIDPLETAFFVFLSLTFFFVVAKGMLNLWQWLSGRAEGWPKPVLRSATLLGLLVFSLSSFGTYAYPRISPAVGGGQPTQVRLVVSEEATDLTSIGLPFEKGNLTEPVMLLYQTNERLIVVVERSGQPASVLEIPADLVAAVEHLP